MKVWGNYIYKQLTITSLSLAALLVISCAGSNEPEMSKSNSSGEAGSVLSAFEGNLHGVLKKQCGSCHGAAQAPQFAVDSAKEAYATIELTKLIDLASPSDSRIVAKINANHNCGGEEACPAFAETVTKAIQEMADAAASSGEEVSSEAITNGSGEVLLSSAVSKEHPVLSNSYYLFEAENYMGSGMELDSDITPVSKTEYVSAKTGEDVTDKNLRLLVDLDGDEKLLMWVKYQSAGTANLGVVLNQSDLGDFGDKLPSTGAEWKWAKFNTLDNFMEIGGANAIFITPTDNTIKIDKVVLTSVDSEEMSLARDVITFNLIDALGVPATIQMTATKDPTGVYRLGLPVLFSNYKIRVKNLKIFFNGKRGANESTFELIDLVSNPGMTVLATSTQAIPYGVKNEGDDPAPQDDDVVELSFETLEVID